MTPLEKLSDNLAHASLAHSDAIRSLVNTVRELLNRTDDLEAKVHVLELEIENIRKLPGHRPGITSTL